MKKIYLLIVAALFSLGIQAQQVNMDQFKSMKARSIGPGAMSGRVTAIDAIHENPNIIYAGTASGGLWSRFLTTSECIPSVLFPSIRKTPISFG
jgi:hypothetical protein